MKHLATKLCWFVILKKPLSSLAIMWFPPKTSLLTMYMGVYFIYLSLIHRPIPEWNIFQWGIVWSEEVAVVVYTEMMALGWLKGLTHSNTCSANVPVSDWQGSTWLERSSWKSCSKHRGKMVRKKEHLLKSLFVMTWRMLASPLVSWLAFCSKVCWWWP